LWSWYKIFRRQKQLCCLDLSIKAQQPKNQQYKAQSRRMEKCAEYHFSLIFLWSLSLHQGKESDIHKIDNKELLIGTAINI